MDWLKGAGKMKKTIYVVMFTILTVTFITAGVDAAERKKWGIGVMAGQPTGFTGKFMLNDTSAIDLGFGWSTSSDDEYAIYSDYLYHIYDLFGAAKGQLPLYFGGGLSYVKRSARDDKFGVRIPIGVEYLFKKVPLGAFLEVVPVMNVTPDTDFDLQGGVGIRFFF